MRLSNLKKQLLTSVIWKGFVFGFYFSLLLHQRLSAQLTDTTKRSFKYLSTGSFSKTTAGTTWLVSNSFNYSQKRNKNVFNVNAGWIYSNFNKELTNNDFSSSLDFDLYKTIPRFYYWGLAAFDKSFSLKIVNRFQGGFGGAYNLLASGPFKLNFSDGILYEYSDLYLIDSTREMYNTFRNSLRLSYRLNIRDLVILDGKHFFQNSLSRGDDYIVKSSSSLSVRLRKWISVTAAFLYNKINRTHRENFLLTYGITIETNF